MPICENCKGCGAIYSWMKMEMITCPTCKGTGKTEQTNEEYIRSCSTRQLANELVELVLYDMPLYDRLHNVIEPYPYDEVERKVVVDECEKWLKEKRK